MFLFSLLYVFVNIISIILIWFLSQLYLNITLFSRKFLFPLSC